jgi:2-polyprenyl-3-methyl-5-hydroxy-6-metoxy-1,4-benzoquinol methylase
VGSGPFFELERLPRTDHRWTVCDIDRRAIEAACALHGPRIARSDVTEPDGKLPYADGSFSLVVSMDVVEHVSQPEPFVRELRRVLRPGGHLFLTTPNYGSRSLPWIEATVLEAIARAQGFNRKNLHRTPLDRAQLAALLLSAGFASVEVQPIAFGWVLAASARKPAGSLQ